MEETPTGLRLDFYCLFAADQRETSIPSTNGGFPMIIKYKFATDEVTEVEVSDEIGTDIVKIS